MPTPSGTASIEPRASVGVEKRLSVLWVTKGLNRGGTEVLLREMAAVRDERRFDIALAYVDPGSSQLTGDFDELGIEPYCLGAARQWDLRWAWRLRRLMRELDVDVVHSHAPYPAAIARLVSRTFRKQRQPRTVYTEHIGWDALHPVTRWANRWTYRLDDHQVAVSRAVVSGVPRKFRGRLEVVVHGVRIESVLAASLQRCDIRVELGLDPGTVAVLTVANFRPQKRYEDLLRAAAIVRREAPDVVFIAIGTGPLEAEVRRGVVELGLSDCFHMIGHRVDVPSVLASCDVFVLASEQEGLPVAVMEALVVGVPVVATSVGGVPEAVRDGLEGRLVPPFEPPRLAEALLSLIRDKALRLRLGDAAQSRAEHFDIRRAARRIDHIYASLCQKC